MQLQHACQTGNQFQGCWTALQQLRVLRHCSMAMRCGMVASLAFWTRGLAAMQVSSICCCASAAPALACQLLTGTGMTGYADSMNLVNCHEWLLCLLAGAIAAYANYSHYSHHPSGFGQLHMQTSSHFSNSIQMLAAGYVEGYLTAPQIADHWHNQQAWLLSKTQHVDKIYSW